MSYIEDKNFSSVFGNAANDIEFDKVLEADEEDELIENVLSLDSNEDENSEDSEGLGDDFSSTGKDMNFDGSDQRAVIQIGNDHTDDLDINISVEAEFAAMEACDDNDDFHETTGENDKDAADIKDELEGRPDDGNNDHTDNLDIDMSTEAGTDFDENTGKDNKDPEDIKNDLEGRPDDGCNKHTGSFDPVKGSDTSIGNYGSADHDLDNLEDAAGKASDKGEDLYNAGKLSTEAAEEDVEDDLDELEVEAALLEMDTEADNGIEEGEDPEPGYDMDNYEGQEDNPGTDDYEGQEDYDGQEDNGGVAESADEEDEDLEGDEDFDDDFDDEDFDYMDEAAADEDPDTDEDLIDAADENDGEMTQAEVDALVAAGGDDDILDSM